MKIHSFKVCEFNSRRNFLKKTFSFGTAIAALNLTSPFLLSCSKYSSDSSTSTTTVSSDSGISYSTSTKILEISKTSSQGISIANDGTIILIHSVDSNDVNVMLINSNGTIKAFTAICPHQGIKNMWSFSNNQIKCSAHNSIFDSSGTFLSNSSTSGVSNLTSYVISSNLDNYQVQLT
tara:strand:- start:334 stop:867 length:534 start_codon:yes stop_codon:yes gene_type:complete